MQPGQVSEMLRSPAGFHMLKLHERRGQAVDGAPVAQTRMRHILIRANEAMSEGEALRRLNDLRNRIVSGAADFAEMARVHSGDATAARGGELDWVYPGDTVPEFERAYRELKVGEVSQPVRTPFGYHLIQVLERRSADMSPGPAAPAGAPGAARAQGRRGLPGMAAPAARPRSTSSCGWRSDKAPGHRAHLGRARGHRPGAVRASWPPTSLSTPASSRSATAGS